MSTRERGSVVGTEIVVDGGTVRDVRDAGVPEGTCIEAKQLFFNIPARRKFLRAETTEAAHVEHQVRLHALAAPEVRFTLIKDGRTVFDLAGASDWRVRISGLAGREAANQLIAVNQHAGRGMTVSGYVLPAEYARKGKRQQFVFLNGRPIEDSAISRALRDGYRGAVQEGVHPAAWLWIDMDPELVDVNVHPAKREVRFHRPHEIRNLIAEAVENALTPKTPPAGASAGKMSISSGSDFARGEGTVIEPEPKRGGLPDEKPEVDHEVCSLPSLPEPTSQQVDTISRQVEFPHQEAYQEELTTPEEEKLTQLPEFRLIGPLHGRYVLFEGDEGLVLLDPAAARERIVYEDLLKRGEEGGVGSQSLLVPEILELDAVDADLVLRHAEHFAEAGMVVEDFGGSTVKVSSLPAFLELSDVHGFLLELVDELHATVGTRRGKALAFESFAAGVAKRIGRNEPCRRDHAEALLKAMFACDLPYCTPDGRPTLIHISLNELDRKFGR
jgi:DNA mismatch repair protein MutL